MPACITEHDADVVRRRAGKSCGIELLGFLIVGKGLTSQRDSRCGAVGITGDLLLVRGGAAKERTRENLRALG